MSAFELVQNLSQRPVIKVIGVGGGGGNAVSHMVESGLSGIDFIATNTDVQALEKSSTSTVLQIGKLLTKGLGAGAKPDIGRQAAMEDRDRIRELLVGTDMLFIAAGMGGGTGTGAAPIIAEISRELGILTVAVVTRPFKFEGRNREQQANAGLKALAEHVDSLITIPNDRLLTILGKEASLSDSFRAANNVLLGAVRGISDVIIRPGEINLDFADVTTVMSIQGLAMMGAGEATGDDRAIEATNQAIASPLLDNINLAGAEGILVNVTTNGDLSMGEFSEVGELIQEFASETANVIIGMCHDDSLQQGELKVTIVATGLGKFTDTSLPLNARTSLRTAASAVDGSLAAPIRQKSDQEKLFGDILDVPAFLRRQAD
ncbi:GTP-binding tubulin-like cell division protein FtsZ [Gammaproteobacteria bacterium]|nr:GTP-binding tubulin-like cell division protein FtsZ [Gammaproteobacteria bacterium]